MTTALTASWPAITVRPWRRCSSTSRAAGFGRRSHERSRAASGHLGPSHRRDDPALLVSAAVVLAAPSGVAVLADHAGYHLGLPADLCRAERQFLRACRRHADRCRDPVGHLFRGQLGFSISFLEEMWAR